MRYVKAGELIPDPRNYRKHPESQTQAVLTMLERTGWVDAAIARETDEGLKLVDGHLRASLSPDDLVPTLVVDISEAEAGEVLATLDPLAAMAEIDVTALDALLADIDVETDFDLGEVVADIRDFAQIDMPEASNPPTDAHHTPLADVDTAPTGDRFTTPHSDPKKVFPWTLHIPRDEFQDVVKRARLLAEHWGTPDDAAATVMKALELAEAHELHGD